MVNEGTDILKMSTRHIAACHSTICVHGPRSPGSRSISIPSAFQALTLSAFIDFHPSCRCNDAGIKVWWEKYLEWLRDDTIAVSRAKTKMGRSRKKEKNLDPFQNMLEIFRSRVLLISHRQYHSIIDCLTNAEKTGYWHSDLTMSLLFGQGTGSLYPWGRGTRHVGLGSGQCRSRFSMCVLDGRALIALILSRQGM